MLIIDNLATLVQWLAVIDIGAGMNKETPS